MIKRIRPSFFFRCIRLGHHHSLHHSSVYYGLVPAGEKNSLIDLAGNLLRFCAVPGGYEDIHDGFFDFYL